MDGNQFDNLVRRFHQGELGRRQFVIRSLVIAVGATGATRLALAQDADPTPTPSSIQAPAGSGETNQQLPCPGPTGPFDWLCGTGPFDPWYPIVAPPDITAATGISWYGIQGLDSGGLLVSAFSQAGDELNTYRSGLTGDRLGWVMGDAAATIEGSFDPPRVDGETVRITGEVNGAPVATTIARDGIASPDPEAHVQLNAGQQLLLTQWVPVLERLDGLLALSLTTEQDPLEASDLGCFAAGYFFGLSLPLCIGFPGAGCLPAGSAGAYIANHCTDSW